MARAKAANRVSKPPAMAAGKRSRRGRPMADSCVELLEQSSEAQKQDSRELQDKIRENDVLSAPAVPQSAPINTPDQPELSLKTPRRTSSASVEIPSTELSHERSRLSEQPSRQLKDDCMRAAAKLPTPLLSMSPRATTPVEACRRTADSSSGLSSAPESIGSTPEGLTSPSERPEITTTRDASPLRRSARTRKRSAKAFEIDDAQTMSKRRKIAKQATVDILPSIEESPDQGGSKLESGLRETLARDANKVAKVMTRKRKAVAFDEDQEVNLDGNDLDKHVPNKKPKLTTGDNVNHEIQKTSNEIKKSSNKPVPSKKNKKSKADLAKERRFYQELAREVVRSDAARAKDKELWPEFNRSRVIMYGSDAQTHYTPAYADAPRRGGKNNGRGAARGGGRGGSGNGRGRGGRARGKGRDDDSPEPPMPRRPQPQEDALLIKHAKARQAELRKFFSVVGNQQTEILDVVSSRDLNRLAKKSKAHKSVPEYEQILKDLGEWEGSAIQIAQKQYEIAVEAENRRYEAEKEAIEARCRNKIADLQEEYKKGAQGDLIIFRRAIAAAHDETRTQDGSEADYFPQYHEMSEPNENIRGYTSTRIMDEKAFKHHLLTYDDQARREVIDDDIGPIVQAFARKNAEQRAEEQRRKTQTIEALSEEAQKRLKETEESLKETRGYLIPRPMVREEDVNSYALSCLADVADFMAQKHPNKQYIYMPLAEGDTYPVDALNYDRLPGRGVKVPQPPMPHPQTEKSVPPPRDAIPQPPSAVSHVQGTRRSLRNLQPVGPLAQPQTQPTTPVSATPAPLTPAVSAGSGPALAPAPPKLAPAPSSHQSQPQPPPINARPQIPTPPERSPAQNQPNQPQLQPGHTLPPLQPRHMSQSALPPPPPSYGYPQQYSPTHPTQPYPPPLPQHGVPSPYQTGPTPSPYRPQHHSMPPSPYVQQPPYHPYGPPPYYQPPHPPPHQHYSFMPPQQGTGLSQQSPDQGPRSNAPPPPMGQYPDPYQNSYHHHHHHRNLSNPFTPQNPPPNVNPQPQPAPPPRAIGAAKGRGRVKVKQPVTFVNQTLATRKAAAEQLAREEAAAAAEKKQKEREKAKSGGTGIGTGNNRKLAPRS